MPRKRIERNSLSVHFTRQDFVDFAANTRPRQYTDVRKFEKFTPAMPLRQAFKSIAPDQQDQRSICANFATKVDQGINAVGMSLPIQFALVDSQAILSCERRVQDGQPLSGSGDRLRTVRRNPSRNQAHFCIERVGRFQRDAQVANVDWIEGAAKDSQRSQ